MGGGRKGKKVQVSLFCCMITAVGFFFFFFALLILWELELVLVSVENTCLSQHVFGNDMI